MEAVELNLAEVSHPVPKMKNAVVRTSSGLMTPPSKERPFKCFPGPMVIAKMPLSLHIFVSIYRKGEICSLDSRHLLNDAKAGPLAVFFPGLGHRFIQYHTAPYSKICAHHCIGGQNLVNELPRSALEPPMALRTRLRQFH